MLHQQDNSPVLGKAQEFQDYQDLDQGLAEELVGVLVLGLGQVWGQELGQAAVVLVQELVAVALVQELVAE